MPYMMYWVMGTEKKALVGGVTVIQLIGTCLILAVAVTENSNSSSVHIFLSPFVFGIP